MSQNGQTHFENLAVFAARFLKWSNHFGTLSIEGLSVEYQSRKNWKFSHETSLVTSTQTELEITWWLIANVFGMYFHESLK